MAKKKDENKVETVSFKASVEEAETIVEEEEIVGEVDHVEDSMASIKEQVVKPPKPPARPPLSKDTRHYEGPPSKLMNALYDSMINSMTSPWTGQIVFDVADLEGWSRTSIHLSKACGQLEKAGWRKR